MNKSIIIGIIMMIAGFALIIFRDKFTKDAVSFQNKAFGFHFGQRIVDLGMWFVIPFGVFFIVLGVLVLTGVWHLK